MYTVYVWFWPPLPIWQQMRAATRSAILISPILGVEMIEWPLFPSARPPNTDTHFPEKSVIPFSQMFEICLSFLALCVSFAQAWNFSHMCELLHTFIVHTLYVHSSYLMRS